MFIRFFFGQSSLKTVKTVSVVGVSVFILQKYHSHKGTRAQTPYYHKQDDALYQSKFLPLSHCQEIWEIFLEM